MKFNLKIFFILFLFVSFPFNGQSQKSKLGKGKIAGINLPRPLTDGIVSIEKSIQKRRTVREYSDEPLNLKEISQLLWAAQGITDKSQLFRSAPSAGALFPLEIYLVAGNIKTVPSGIYKYIPHLHKLMWISAGDKREELYAKGTTQKPVLKAPATIVISAVYERSSQKYGQRAAKYVQMEAGAAGENIHLQAQSLNLGVAWIGAFFDNEVKKILKLQKDESPLLLMPVGKPVIGDR